MSHPPKPCLGHQSLCEVFGGLHRVSLLLDTHTHTHTRSHFRRRMINDTLWWWRRCIRVSTHTYTSLDYLRCGTTPCAFQHECIMWLYLVLVQVVYFYRIQNRGSPIVRYVSLFYRLEVQSVNKFRLRRHCHYDNKNHSCIPTVSYVQPPLYHSFRT